MKLFYPVLFVLAVVINFVLVVFISFNYVYSIHSPLLAEFIQIYPNYHFGLFHNLFNNILPNGIIANQWALALGYALAISGAFLIIKNFFLKEKKQKWFWAIPFIGLMVGYLLSQAQGLDYLSSYKASYWYALGLSLLGFGLFLNKKEGSGKIYLLVISAFAFAAFLGHHFVPDKHIGLFYFSFSPNLGALTIADILIIIGLLFWGVKQIIGLISPSKGIITSLILGCCCFACNPDSKLETIPESNLKRAISQRTKDYNPNKNAYFGDLHLHTNFSFDAYVRGRTELYPDEAYQFAKGDTVLLKTGEKAHLKTPLDFLAVTDHSEYLGVLSLTDKEELLKILEERPAFEYVDEEALQDGFVNVGRTLAEGTPMKGLFRKGKMSEAWNIIIEAANKHYQPGKFTTFIGYEWTSVIPIIPKYKVARNLHRNVIFGNDVIPAAPFSSFDSKDPEALWNWMELLRKQGSKVLAIPHNANVSNGMMYGHKRMNGADFDKNYALTRMKNEPISEVMQRKGQAMAHPVLSPEDEFADYHVDHFLFGNDPNYKADIYKGSYMREALKDGIQFQNLIGANPFQYGLIGSTDLHDGMSNTNKDDFYGDVKASADRANYRQSDDYEKLKMPGGLAAVWAEENTRESIFSAMERKETFVTSGSRIQVRFFGAWAYPDSIFKQDWIDIGYKKGVAMGNVLTRESSTTNREPSFIIWATKDPDGANLDRVQIIKGWVDSDGNTHEKVYNVAWSDMETRKLNNNGKVAAIPNTVNISTATYTNEFGNISLQAIWKDADFDPKENAVYYVRVLEIPTPSAACYDAKYLGKPVPNDLPASVQERAWSSPIWYYAE